MTTIYLSDPTTHTTSLVSTTNPLPITMSTGIAGEDLTNDVMKTFHPGIPSLAADLHAPADNTSAVVTYAAAAGVKHYLHDVFWSYDSTLTAVGTLTITDDTVAVFGPLSITQPGPGFLHFDPPIVASVANKAMVVTLTTGGATVQCALSCRHEAK